MPQTNKKLATNLLQEIFERLLFASRWIQAPLYFGLILAQLVFAYKFFMEVVHLVSNISTLNESQMMLIVLGLIDIVMVANLLLMVTVGGYQTFVSKLDFLHKEHDQPEWLSHVNAGVLKVKLATAIVGISSIHLLRTFIDAQTILRDNPNGNWVIMWQTILHMVFILSAILLAYTDNVMNKGLALAKREHLEDD